MRAHTRKHHIKETKQEEREEIPMSAQEMLDKLSNGKPEWAQALHGYRCREGLTQSKLGELLGIEQSNISKMERGERPIGKTLAKKFAAFFKTDYRFFL